MHSAHKIKYGQSAWVTLVPALLAFYSNQWSSVISKENRILNQTL